MMVKKFYTHTPSGFTLIELLVVISIIGLLVSVSMASLTQARLSAQYTKARADIKNLANLAEFAKGTQNQTLNQITGDFCTECDCRGAGNPLPVPTSIHTFAVTHACHTSYQAVVSLLNTQTDGLYTIPTAPLDPWDAPYLINENEGEGGTCATDTITSAGPDGIYYNSNDVIYNLPSTKCNNPTLHHPNTNWN